MKFQSSIVTALRATSLWLIPGLFLIFFYFLPLIEIIQRSGILQHGLYLTASEWPIVTKPLSLTFLQAVLSTGLTLFIGIPGAYVLSHYRFAGRDIFKAILIVPFILPTVVVSACFNSLLGPHGLINELLMTFLHLAAPPIHLLNSFWAIILGHVFYNTSIIILIVAEAWSRLNPNYAAVARLLGANTLKTLIKITLPLLTPALLSATLLVFIFDFTSFGVIMLLGGPLYATLEVEIYIQAIQLLNFRMATILSLLQIALTLTFSVVYTRVSHNQTFEIIPTLNQGFPLEKAAVPQKALMGGILSILFLLFFSPLAALLIRSLTGFADQTTGNSFFFKDFTWSFYSTLFANHNNDLFYIAPYRAILNSTLFALITVIITVPMAILIVMALRQSHHINRLIEPLVLLPLGTSAVTLGLGLLLVFNSTPLYQMSFPLLLPISHALVALPMAVRIIQPALNNIAVSLSQSARMLGANRWQVFRKIDLPLLRGPILIAAVFSFSVSLGEFGATTFLYRPQYTTIPIAIFRFLTHPGQANYGQAMAMSTILMVLCILSILIIQVIGRKGEVKGR